MRFLVLILAVCVAVSGFASDEGDVIDGVTIGNGTTTPRKSGVVAILEPVAGGWEIKSIIDYREFTARKTLRQNPNQEILYVSGTLDFIQPLFQDTGMLVANTFECSAFGDQPAYSPCNSKLTKVSVVKSVGKNLFAAALTAGLASGTHKRVDSKKVFDAAKSSGLFEAAREEYAQIQIARQESLAKEQNERYLAEFMQARSVEDWSRFIERYSQWDPNNFVPVAIEKRDSALAQEAETELARKVAADRMEEERRSKIQMFRQTVDETRETNCGPVLEIKGDLVKVYFPVADYGNEHWLRVAELYPPEYGCVFVNGRYAGPRNQG
jgi:hypothetical protein